MKNKKLIICTLLIFIALMMLFSQTVFADEWDDLGKKIGGISAPTETTTETTTVTTFARVCKIVLNLIRTAGAGIALIMVTITGIRYMISSAEDKADYKKKLIPMAIGAVLLFSATEIIAIVGNVALNL